MLFRIIQRSRSLEMMQCFSEFPSRQTRGPHGPMGNAQRCRVVMVFGLPKELYGRISLLGDFASDVMACPYPVENGKLLSGIGQMVSKHLRAQQCLLSFGRRVPESSYPCLTEHHLQPKCRTLACCTFGNRPQQFESTRQVSNRLGIG